MKTFIILTTLLFTLNSWALDFVNFPSAEDGSQVIGITGGINKNQKYPDLKLKRGARIFISSPGGTPDQLTNLLTWFKSQLKGKHPTIILNNFCASTCIPFLNALNNLAGKNKLELILDNKLRLGFHGCYNPNPQFMLGCNLYMRKFMILEGMDADWQSENIKLFERPTKEYLVVKRASDPILQNSGLINHAHLEDDTKKYMK